MMKSRKAKDEGDDDDVFLAASSSNASKTRPRRRSGSSARSASPAANSSRPLASKFVQNEKVVSAASGHPVSFRASAADSGSSDKHGLPVSLRASSTDSGSSELPRSKKKMQQSKFAKSAHSLDDDPSRDLFGFDDERGFSPDLAKAQKKQAKSLKTEEPLLMHDNRANNDLPDSDSHFRQEHLPIPESETQRRAHIAFSQAIEHSAKLPWRRGRIILVGKGQTGKSSTVRSLMGKPYDPTLASTVGLDTANLEVNRAEVQNWSEQGVGREMVEAMAGLMAQIGEKNVDPEILHNSTSLPSGPVAGSGASAAFAKRKRDRDVSETQVQEVAKLLTEEMLCKGDKKLTFSLWDCGGQQVFYNLIHLFFTRCAAYLCIFDMRQMLNDDQRDEALETLSFWLDSVHLHARGAPVLLVGTFGDVVDMPEQWQEIDRLLWDNFRVRIQECVRPFNSSAGDFWFFPMDNTKKTLVTEQLRVSIERAVLDDEMRYIDREVPVAWRQVLDRMRGAVGEDSKEFMTFEDVQNISESNAVPEWQVPEMLKVFHDLGTILHFPSLPELKRILILQPQWLIDAICCLICDFSLHERTAVHGHLARDHAADFEHLKSSGVATRPLLDAIWRDYDASDSDYMLRNFFIKLLQEMVLICPLPEGRWLVPGLLPKQDLPPRDPELTWMTFWVDCSKSSLPPGLFSRLVCLFAEFCHELGGVAECLGSSSAEMLFGAHRHARFRMEVEEKIAIRFDVVDSSAGPSFVLRQATTFMEQVTVEFMKGLEFEILLGTGILNRTSAPSKSDVSRAILKESATFRPPWSKQWFRASDFGFWFAEGTHMSKVVQSQWSRLSDDWPFLQRYEYADDKKAALHRYLQDPGGWGLEWSSLERLEREVTRLEPYREDGEDPVPWQKMNMWHVVQLLVKPLCAEMGAPLALIYGDWQPRKVEEFISHCWSESFCEFMASLRHVYETRKQKPTLFICAFALYQGTADDVGRQLAGPIRDAPFIKALRVSRHFVAVRNQDKDIYTRAWCLVEFIFAKKLGFFSHKVSITGPNTFASAGGTSCLDVEASDENDRQRVLEFLLQEATVQDMDKQIQEFRDYDAGFDLYHSHFRNTD